MVESSVDKSHMRINPWASDVYSTSATASVIRYAEKNRLLRLRRDEELQETREQLKRESPSLRLIRNLREISEKRAQLDQANYDIECRLMDKETRDLTHLDILESKVGRLAGLSSHIQRVQQEKKELLHRLQQPLVGDYLRLEASCHPQLHQLFPLIARCLGDLTSNLDTVQWGSQFNIHDGKMVEVLDEIATSLAQIQTGLHTIMQARTLVTERAGH